MKLLPHYFKWIGIGLLFASIILGFDGFVRGFWDGVSGGEYNNFTPVFPDFFSQIADFVTLMGLLVYILAKNKTEDEFAQKLRYESAFIVLVLTIVVLLIVILYRPGIQISPAVLLLLQMVAYLIIRRIKNNVFFWEDYEEQS